jgi:hypothetical protein
LAELHKPVLKVYTTPFIIVLKAFDFHVVGLGYIWLDDNSNDIPSVCNLVLDTFQVRRFEGKEIVISGGEL